jgi:hypothetical protein
MRSGNKKREERNTFFPIYTVECQKYQLKKRQITKCNLPFVTALQADEKLQVNVYYPPEMKGWNQVFWQFKSIFFPFSPRHFSLFSLLLFTLPFSFSLLFLPSLSPFSFSLLFLPSLSPFSFSLLFLPSLSPFSFSFLFLLS